MTKLQLRVEVIKVYALKEDSRREICKLICNVSLIKVGMNLIDLTLWVGAIIVLSEY